MYLLRLTYSLHDENDKLIGYRFTGDSLNCDMSLEDFNDRQRNHDWVLEDAFEKDLMFDISLPVGAELPMLKMKLTDEGYVSDVEIKARKAGELQEINSFGYILFSLGVYDTEHVSQGFTKEEALEHMRYCLERSARRVELDTKKFKLIHVDINDTGRGSVNAVFSCNKDIVESVARTIMKEFMFEIYSEGDKVEYGTKKVSALKDGTFKISIDLSR